MDLFLKFSSGECKSYKTKTARHTNGASGEPTTVVVKVFNLKRLKRAEVSFESGWYSDMRGIGGVSTSASKCEDPTVVALAEEFLADDTALVPLLLAYKAYVAALPLPADAKPGVQVARTSRLNKIDRFLLLARTKDVTALKKEEFKQFMHKFKVGDKCVAHFKYQGSGWYNGDAVEVTLATEKWDDYSREWVYETTCGRKVTGKQLKPLEAAPVA